MSVERAVKNLRVMLRADGVIAEIRLRHALTQATLHVLAGLVACFALLMLDVAAYLALRDVWGPIWAAIGISVGNLVIAALLVLIAGRVGPGRELELAREVHETALQALTEEARLALRNPFDGILSGVVGQLVGAFIKSRRERE